MALRTRCPECATLLQFPEDSRGRKVRCPTCKRVFVPDDAERPIEAEAVTAAAPAPKPASRPEEAPRPKASAAPPAEAVRRPAGLTRGMVWGLIIGGVGLGACVALAAVYLFLVGPLLWEAPRPVAQVRPVPPPVVAPPPPVNPPPPPPPPPPPLRDQLRVLLKNLPAFDIPQQPAVQAKRYEDMLAWNRRTLAGAYDKVGKKDPRWDEPARAALEAAARAFSYALDPPATYPAVVDAAKKAIDAGCDDPLILYLYARAASYPPNVPPKDELRRRFTAAAAGMETSDYPPFRRALAIGKALLAIAEERDVTDADKKEAARLVGVVLDLLARSRAEDEQTPDMDHNWLDLAETALRGQQLVAGDEKAAYDHVDAVLTKTPALKPTRLVLRGRFLTRYAWAARGSGLANTVTPEGWEKFRERLIGARQALQEAWAEHPGDGEAASLMLTVEKGLGGDRVEMDRWFERAMKADGNNRAACEAMLDFHDPKWGGTPAELVGFGRACRDTRNWRAGLTLVVAEAHYRLLVHLPPPLQNEYMRLDEVWTDIRDVYDEFLTHYPEMNGERTKYAAYCYACGKYAEADAQFRRLGDNVVPSYFFPEPWLRQVRTAAAQLARQQQPPPERKAPPEAKDGK